MKKSIFIVFALFAMLFSSLSFAAVNTGSEVKSKTPDPSVDVRNTTLYPIYLTAYLGPNMVLHPCSPFTVLPSSNPPNPGFSTSVALLGYNYVYFTAAYSPTGPWSAAFGPYTAGQNVFVGPSVVAIPGTPPGKK